MDRSIGKRIGVLFVLALLCAQPASATWALVAHAKSGNADGQSGPFRAPNGAATVNASGADLYLCAIASYYAGADHASSILADVSGNTYTALTAQTAAGDSSVHVVWMYKVAPTTSSVEAWTVTDANTFTGVTCGAFSGTAMSPTITHAESGTTSTTPSAGSLGSAGDIVLTAVADYTVTVSSIDSSFSITDQSNYTAANNIGIAMAWPNLSGGVAGAVNPTWTLSGSPLASAVQAISFTGTGGGSPTSRPCSALRLLGVGCLQ